MRSLFLGALLFTLELVSSKPINPRDNSSDTPLTQSDQAVVKLNQECYVVDGFPGSWKRLGTCSDGVAPPRMFPNGDQKSQLRCCIPLDCSISFQGVGITKSGQCKMKTYCPDEFRMTSQGIQERQELYQDSSLRYGFEDSGCCTTTSVAANSSLEPPQGLNDAENSLRPVLQDLILSSNPVPNYMPPQPPPPTLSPWDAFSSSSDPLAPQSFGVQKISYLPLSTEDSDFLDI